MHLILFSPQFIHNYSNNPQSNFVVIVQPLHLPPILKHITNYMKRILFSLLIIALSISAFAQQHRTCFSPEVTNRLRTENPVYDNQMKMTEDALRKFVATGQQDPYFSARAVRTIPVVVHVVYNTNAQNVSTAAIQLWVFLRDRLT